jgi:hypothetical protein
VKSIVNVISEPSATVLKELKSANLYGTFHVSVRLTSSIDLLPVETFVSRCILINVDSHEFICEIDSGFEHN